MNELIEAVEANDIKKVKQLIRCGIDVNTTDKYGFRNPLKEAVNKNNIEIARLLIESGANVNCCCLGQSVLFETSDIEMAKLLIKNGADINAQDFTGFTVLHRASHLGKVEMVKFLIESGANIDILDRDCKSALDMALPLIKTDLSRKEIVKLLIEAAGKQR